MTANAGGAPPLPTKGFMQDDAGNNSAMRLMSFVSLLAAILFAFLMLIGETNHDDALLIVFGFLVGAFAPKAVQKFAETKVPNK